MTAAVAPPRPAALPGRTLGSPADERIGPAMGWVLSPVGWVFISPARGTAVARPIPSPTGS